MVYRKIKSLLGRDKPSKRHTDTEQGATPDDTIDPETWQSEARPGLAERLRRRKRALSIYGFLGFVVLGILFFYASDFMVGAFTHPLTKAVVSYGGVGTIAYLAGAKYQRGKLTNSDWLVCLMPEGVVIYLGQYERRPNDEGRVFVPFTGFDLFGMKERQLALKELGDEIARAHAKNGRDPDSPARIRVDDAITETSDTAYGTVVACLTGGLELDHWGQHSDVYTSPPNLVDEERYQELNKQLEKFVEVIVPKKNERLEALEQHIDNLRARLEETDDDAVDKFIDRHSKALAVQQQATASDGDDDDSGVNVNLNGSPQTNGNGYAGAQR